MPGTMTQPNSAMSLAHSVTLDWPFSNQYQHVLPSPEGLKNLAVNLRVSEQQILSGPENLHFKQAPLGASTAMWGPTFKTSGFEHISSLQSIQSRLKKFID